MNKADIIISPEFLLQDMKARQINNAIPMDAEFERLFDDIHSNIHMIVSSPELPPNVEGELFPQIKPEFKNE